MGDVAPWPHRLALLVAALTLPLIFMGGRVMSTGSGMAVYDWPTTLGQNMFFFPWSQWTGQISIEHSHRIAGSIVGLASVLLALVMAWKDPRPGVRWLGFGVLALVSLQGVIGGMRVTEGSETLATIHGFFAQACFGFMAAVVAVTGRGWREAVPVASAKTRKLRALSLALAAVAYGQIVLGAVYRHAVLPGTRGALLGVHMLVAALLLGLAIVLVKNAKRESPLLARTGKLLHAFLGTQILLGIISWRVLRADFPMDLKVTLVSLHLDVAALVFGVAVAMALQVRRALVPRETLTDRQFSKALDAAVDAAVVKTASPA
jgi:cytochrome c oxidase assembly protein subunit 15